MRYVDEQTGALFSYSSPEMLVAGDHPLRPIRLMMSQGPERKFMEHAAMVSRSGVSMPSRVSACADNFTSIVPRSTLLILLPRR